MASISLTKGWNLISIPLNLVNNSISSVFDNFSYIFSFNNSNKKWLFYKNESSNNFKEINEKMGLWVKSPQDKTLAIEGYPFDYPVDISLYKGWNLVGYPFLNITKINETLKGINYSVIYGYN